MRCPAYNTSSPQRDHGAKPSKTMTGHQTLIARSDNEGTWVRSRLEGRMMKKIGGTDCPRPLQMCLASNPARATIDGTSFDFHTNQTNITGQSEHRLISMLE